MRWSGVMGLRSKRHRFKSARLQGGNLFSRGQIHAALRNPIYIGKIRNKTKVWNGQHEPIASEVVWEQVQAKPQAASARLRGRKTNARQLGARPIAPLTGKLGDETGDRLTPTHNRCHGGQTRCHVSNRLISGGTDPGGWRLAALALEQEVASTIAAHIVKPTHVHRICANPDLRRNDAIRARPRQLADWLLESAPDLLEEVLDVGRLRSTAVL